MAGLGSPAQPGLQNDGGSMPGTINAPLLGDDMPENDEPYTIVKINYVKVKPEKKKKEKKTNDRKPNPLLEE